MTNRSSHNPIMVLNLGSCRTAALLLVRRGDGFVIAGSGIAIANGIANGTANGIAGGIAGGVIVDMQAAVAAVAKAGEQAERTAGVTADGVLVVLPAAMSSSHTLNREVTIAERVEAADLARLEAEDDPKQKVIHQNIVNYRLDGAAVKNPLGMRGRSLTARLHRVVAEPNGYANLMQILRLCRFVNHIHFVPSICAAARAVLGEEERHRPVVVADLGGGITSFAVFADQARLLHTDFVPLGGDHVTKDIAYAFAAAHGDAEKLKLDPNSSQITTMEGKQRMIQHHELERVVTPRLEETFELLRTKINALTQAVDYHLVLTGGASRIKDAAAVAGRIFNRSARLAKPSYRVGLPQSVHGPGFAALLGAADNAQTATALIRPQSNWLNRLGLWFRECFEDEAELYQ